MTARGRKSRINTTPRLRLCVFDGLPLKFQPWDSVSTRAAAACQPQCLTCDESPTMDADSAEDAKGLGDTVKGRMFTITFGDTRAQLPWFYAETSGLLCTLVHEHNKDELELPKEWKYTVDDLKAFGAFVQYYYMATEDMEELVVVDLCRAFRVADYLDSHRVKFAIGRELSTFYSGDLDFLLFAALEFNHLKSEFGDHDIFTLFMDRAAKSVLYARPKGDGDGNGEKAAKEDYLPGELNVRAMQHPNVAQAAVKFMMKTSPTMKNGKFPTVVVSVSRGTSLHIDRRG